MSSFRNLLVITCSNFDSLEKNTGFWDRGREAIIEWLDAHKCKTLCKKLGLANAVLSELHPEPMPLRTGWPSPSPSKS
jgi:hypothetical protein